MYYQLKALILRSDTASEADKLLTAYTYEWGKVAAVVPGAKKIKAKLSPATEPVTESELMVYLNHPSARPKVTGARIVENYSAVKTDWRRLAFAQYCAEISEVLTPYNAENPKKYDLLARTWHLLTYADHPDRIVTAYILRFLKLSGYSFTEYMRQGHTSIPSSEQRLLRRLARVSGDEVDRMEDLSPEEERAARRHVDNYLNQYLPRPLSTRQFVHKVRVAASRRPALKKQAGRTA